MSTEQPIRLGLVADDVTGASDASVQFARRGWDTLLSLEVRLKPDTTGDEFGDPSPPVVSGFSRTVTAVTTDSRALPDSAAEQLTYQAVTSLIDAGIDRVFLKIDSTMRGSVQGQIAGALKAWRTRYADARAVVCPAYPRMGRTVQAHRLFVHGEPVDRTAVGRDPVTPVTTSDMNALIPASLSITIADAVTDEDLTALAKGISGSPSIIPVGSGGFAEALAEIWSVRTQPGRGPERVVSISHDPRILLLVSSLNPVSHVQVTKLREAFPNVNVVIAPTERVGGPSVAERLAVEFSARVERERWDLVGLIGGDGARAALTRLGASGIRIRDSMIEGIPIGVVVGGRANGLPVFTKAGGFGAEDALVKAMERITA